MYTEPAEQYVRDNIRNSTDPELTRRIYHFFMPEWLVPNVRLKQQHFLPKCITPLMTDQEVQVFFHSINDKMEAYSFVRRLFEEHNANARAEGKPHDIMFLETSYLFCMDVVDSTMSSNFFMYIPKSHYRRYLEDVPLLYNTKSCIIVDYHRRLAFRFGICISKMTEEVDAHSEDRSSVADASTERSVTTARGGGGGVVGGVGVGASGAVTLGGGPHRRGRHADNFVHEGAKTLHDIIAENRIIHGKRNETHQ